MQMFQAQDEPHLKAMLKIQEMMLSPGSFQQWFAEKKAQFDALSDID
jgi:hypothetical protein